MTDTTPAVRICEAVLTSERYHAFGKNGGVGGRCSRTATHFGQSKYWCAQHAKEPANTFRKATGKLREGVYPLDALAAAPVAPGGEGDRETIARIIDPDGWATRDRQHREIAGLVQRGSMTEAEADGARKSSDAYASRSLTKADAILAALRARSEPEAGAVLESFPPETTDVQSRYVLAHQLRASADIQDGQTRRETGWATTSDRVQLMRQAADKLEQLAALAHPAPSDASATERMRAAVLLAADTFERYARLHRAKGTPDGLSKAETNAALGRQMRAALGEA